MYKYMMMGLVIVGVLFGSQEVSTGEGKMVTGSWITPDKNQIPDEETGNYGSTIPVNPVFDWAENSPYMPDLPLEDNGNGGGGGNIEWGTDRLVFSGPNLTLGWLSIDHNENGDLYVTILKKTPGSGSVDTIYHYYSSDGIVWVPFVRINPSPNIFGDTILKQEVLVGTGSNPWIYTFFLSKKVGTPNSGGIYMRRVRADSSAYNWITIAVPGDSIFDFAVDRDNNGNLYLVYRKLVGSDYNIYRTRSLDEGATWSSPVLVGSGNRRDPEVACGNEDYFYIAYVVDDTILRIGRYINFSSPVFRDVQTEGEPEYTPSIAASRISPGASQTAWVLYRHYHPSANVYDIHYAYTTNGGSSWTSGEPWPPTNIPHNTWLMHHPWIIVAHDYSFDVASAVVSVPETYDSLVYAWADASNPSNWLDRQVLNDHDLTAEYGAKIDISPKIGIWDIAIYRQWGTGKVWADFWANVNAKENLRILYSSPYSVSFDNGFVIIKFSLPYGKNLKINLYSVSGRNLKSIEKYFDSGNHTYRISLPKTGVYFLKIDDRTAKVITVR